MARSTIETAIGTTVVETPQRVYNPVNDEYRDLTKLSEDGYCRRFLALRSHMDTVGTINVDSAPVLSFDKERFELQETGGHYVLVKKEGESGFGERVVES
jgi:hypothetical protein